MVIAIIFMMIYAVRNLDKLPFDIDLKSPINNEVEQSMNVNQGPATIIGVVPIRLDCRAVISIEVPVSGKREHKMFGKVYRTDSMSMKAIGDVAMCIDGQARLETTDMMRVITVPATAVVFDRPRVDAIKTQGTLNVTKGWVGKLTDIFPWVSENNGLTQEGYAFAQSVIGGGKCMESAWQKTVGIVTESLMADAISEGFTEGNVTITIDGTPDFRQNETPDTELAGVNMNIGEVICTEIEAS